MIARAGTLAWALLQDEPGQVAIPVPGGGGGLAAGAALAAHAGQPRGVR
ncbi:hypothetical protein ACFV9D_05435 [Streptomyces sp. NPDC059875]